jgi:OOP family OmpA-OmpF porin
VAKLKKPVKIALIVGGAIAAGGALFMLTGVLPTPAFMKATVPVATGTLAADVNRGVPREAYELPAQPVADFDGSAKILSIPWNATSGLALANGGVRTTADSLVRRFSGGTVEIERQDDYTVIQQNLIAFEANYRGGQTLPNQGAPMAIIMGDGLPGFAAGLEGKADVVVVGVVGFSDGEDQCLGKPLNGDPQNARGSLIAAVPRDGDQNICIKWAADNEIPVNTDNTVYDPTAINFVDTGSFTEANDKYVAGYCEQREVARDGLKSGETQRVCVDGVATWTPGDVVVVENKGGVVSWASTRDYNQQMPAILIANRRWAAENRQFVIGLLRAADRAAFQIRSEPQTFLPQAGAIMANIHGAGGGQEADARFWTTYYVGREHTDAQGNKVKLGGSRVSTLAEVRDFLGLGQGTLNVYKGVYEIFGNYAKAFYPTILPSFPAYDTVVTGDYVRAALAGVQISRSNAPTAFANNTAIEETVSNRSYSITFETGSATITAGSRAQLEELAAQSGMTRLRIRIDGHTDNVGNPASNQTLSRARAQAVAAWLTAKAPTTFPANRIQVRGYGDTEPVASNANPAGQARNRRVEITLGN